MSILYYNFIYLFFIVVGYINLNNIFKKSTEEVLMICFYTLTILIFAFTFDMGGDYSLYKINYNNLSNHSFYYFIFKKEFIYTFISKLFNEIGFPFIIFFIFLKILIISCIFIFVFKSIENKFFILSIFFSYYFYSYTIGYVRQGLSASIFLLIIVYWNRFSLIQYVFSLAFISSIHISSILLTILKVNKENFLIFFYLSIPIIFIYYIFFGTSSFYGLIEIYIIEGNHVSNGFFFRILLFIPAIILFYIYFKNFKLDKNFKIYNTVISIIVPLICLLALLNPTVSDRLLVYLFPFTLLIIDKVLNYIDNIYKKISIYSIITLINFTFLNVWLVFGNNTRFFIPIKNIFLE